MEEVCYTREAALEKAVGMEAAAFEEYKRAYLGARDPLARDLLKDLALDELKHKYTLEKAFFEETVHLHESGVKEGPSMKFSLLFEDKPLTKQSSEQEVFLHAIHEEKRALDFYSKTADNCGGAPMAEMFRRLAKDEEGHLARLEELYEKIYLKEM
ncbi:MAG: ferritin family protein [Deltaproteobacteria bacterium]|nr:ferritin family protein [Deltaproteobacteria bacterium]